MDFFVRDAGSLIPVEVKANDGATASLNKLLSDGKYSGVKYGIKFGYKNIGFNEKSAGSTLGCGSGTRRHH